MKINVDFDTQTKFLKATSDGEIIDNLANIIFYCGKDEDGNTTGMIEITTSEYDKDEKIFKMTRVSAKETDQLVNKDKSLHEEIAELLFKK